MDAHIKLVKRKSNWGNTSWDTFVDGVFVGNCRIKKEAMEIGEARIARLKEEEDLQRQYINDMWDYECRNQ